MQEKPNGSDGILEPTVDEATINVCLFKYILDTSTPVIINFGSLIEILISPLQYNAEDYSTPPVAVLKQPDIFLLCSEEARNAAVAAGLVLVACDYVGKKQVFFYCEGWPTKALGPGWGGRLKNSLLALESLQASLPVVLPQAVEQDRC